MMNEISGMSIEDNFQEDHTGLTQFIRGGKMPKVKA
jgi:hypothetical protein